MGPSPDSARPEGGRRGLRISGKLFLIPSVGIGFLTLLALVAYLGLSGQKAAIVELYQGRLRGLEHSARLIGDLTRVHAGIYQVMSWTSAGYDASRIDELSRNLDGSLDQVRESVDGALRAGTANGAEREHYQAAVQELAAYRKAARGVIDLASVDIGMANTYMSIAEGRFEVLDKRLKSLLALEDRLARESYRRSLDRFAATLTLFLALYAAALLLSILGSVFILQRMVIAPIRSIEAGAQRIAEGDLSFEVAARGGDEIGRLIQLLRGSFGALAGVLRRIRSLSARISTVVESVELESKKVVTGAEVESGAVASISESVRGLDAMAASISESTRSLASSTGDTAAAIEQLVSSIQRIDGNVGELSRGVDSTSSSIEELAQSVNEVAGSAQQLAAASEEALRAVSEIGGTVQVVEKNAKESAALSQKVTTEAATLGLASVDRTMEGMQRIQASVEQTGAFVRALGLRSAEIEQILDVIRDVTDETEILSLNASILAAQAGERGRGFAVVAAEIKDLAERTSGSTREVSAFIRTVQQDVANVTEALGNGLAAAQEGLALAGEAGAALRKVLASSKQSSSMALSIERSTAEQASAARRAAEAMGRARAMMGHIARATAEQSQSASLISQAADRIAAATREVGRSTQEQAASSRLVSRSVENVFQHAQQISKSLSEHETVSKRILASVEQVKDVPAQNRALAASISSTLWELQEDAERLRAEMARFRLGEPEPPGR